jgi:hypothetical protein
MKEQFRAFLKTVEDKTEITSSSYVNSIDKLSEHYSNHGNGNINIYNVHDLIIIRGLCQDYGTGGRYSDIGNYGHGTYRAAINAYQRFLEYIRTGHKIKTLNNGNNNTNRSSCHSSKTNKRTNPADVANLFIRNFLCDISERLGGYTKSDEEKTLEFFDYKCPYTGTNLVNVDIVLDHLIPHNREYCGLNIFGNVIPTIKEANSKKHAKDFRSFLLNDQSVIKANINERNERIKKIEEFIKFSEYNKKISNIKYLQKICEEKYQYILKLCEENQDSLN